MVIKYLFLFKERIESVKEVQVMANLRHNNVVKYFDSFIDGKKSLNIVMEYCNNGDLHALLKKQRSIGSLSEERIWKLFIQITLGQNTF